MKRSELFVGLTGIVGLAADVITLFLFFQQRTAPSSPAPSPSFVHEIVLVFSLVYGWFVLAWILIRRSWTNKKEHRSEFIAGTFFQSSSDKSVFHNRVANAVGALAILLFPISLLLPFYYRIPLENKIRWVTAMLCIDVFCIAVIAFLIYAAIRTLMPIVYYDMHELEE